MSKDALGKNIPCSLHSQDYQTKNEIHPTFSENSIQIKHAVQCSPAFRFHPIVFLYENVYCMMIWETTPTLLWIEIDGKPYYDDVCGVLRSDCPVHKVILPWDVLNKAKAYTVCYRLITKREPAFSETSEIQRVKYPFAPLPSDSSFTACQITDSHGRDDLAISAASFFPFDLLMLTGDLQNHMQTTEEYAHMYRIASALTKGTLPVLYARGNHDCRGAAAQKMPDFTPMPPTRAYYYLEFPHLSFLVLDCGEDKPDDHIEYGNTICFSAYRDREEQYLHALFSNEVPNMQQTRILISHTPFSDTKYPPFDIEIDRYKRWLSLLQTHYAPHLMISGHLHKAQISPIGGELDHKGQICPVVIGGDSPGHHAEKDEMSICHYTFSPDEIRIVFVNQRGETTDTYCVKIP